MSTTHEAALSASLMIVALLCGPFARQAHADCGQTVMNSDGTYEWAHAWSNDAQQAPDYGAFAECFHGPAQVCACLFDFTAIGPVVNDMDVYVWEDDGGKPGSVLQLLPHQGIGGIAFWPSVSRHVVNLLDPVCVGDVWWVGYWGNWPGSAAGWFVGADLDGPGGCPMTHIAPGLGYPSGWQDVGIAFGPTNALGIGAEIQNCVGPVPARRESWGSIKHRYE